MLDVNIKQNQKISFLFGMLAIVTATLGGFLYYQKIKHDKSQRELNELDREIKQIQLADLKKRNGSTPQ